MRLWSLHPQYLDPQGLVALWRETLLAQAVLRQQTRGYRNHPQLDRFKSHKAPLSAMSRYLRVIHAESVRRGYRFDKSKLTPVQGRVGLAVTTGQLAYEWQHLMAKLRLRNPAMYRAWAETETPDPHPIFTLRDGPVEKWEKM